jgi:hypothetical protein
MPGPAEKMAGTSEAEWDTLTPTALQCYTTESTIPEGGAMAKKDFISISMRFDKETYVRLKKIAFLEDRAVSNLMHKWALEKIEEYCDQMKEGCPPTPGK